MPSTGAIAIDWLASGAFVMLLGGLIKFAGWTWLLAGYDESTAGVSDESVRDISGNTILRVGVAVFIVGVLATVTNPPSYVAVVVGGVIVVDVARMIYRLNTLSTTQTA
ncbi:MAG: hypothetical protein ABEJ48_10905 [Halobacteriales archaeon]